MVGVIEYRHYESGKTTVVTTECALCGTQIRDQQGIQDHLPSRPARDIYAERPHTVGDDEQPHGVSSLCKPVG